MDRDKTIVYLGTEGNPKCCLGLKEILEDGWLVKLVIAYVPPSLSSGRRSVLQRAKRTATPFLKRLMQLGGTRHEEFGAESLEFRNMQALCDAHQICYRSTQETSLTSLIPDIERVSPDVILSNGWMFKVSGAVSSRARLIALNCHSSYLPEYRGGNITYAPLINEEKQSGVTVHQLVEKFDAGPILSQKRVSIEPGETPRSLNMKRAQIAGRVITEALRVAGHPELYRPNPPSSFYFRCTRATYRRYKRINSLRKMIGLPIKRYEPQERYDI